MKTKSLVLGSIITLLLILVIVGVTNMRNPNINIRINGSESSKNNISMNKMITSDITARILTLENNQLGQYLKVDVKIDIPVDGFYHVDSWLWEKNDSPKLIVPESIELPKDITFVIPNQYVIVGELEPVNFLMAIDPIQPIIELKKGHQILTLYFLTNKIIDQKIGGPYEISICVRNKDKNLQETALFEVPNLFLWIKLKILDILGN